MVPLLALLDEAIFQKVLDDRRFLQVMLGIAEQKRREFFFGDAKSAVHPPAVNCAIDITPFADGDIIF
jgi:hypothetical protein